jgi:hypothetical protein
VCGGDILLPHACVSGALWGVPPVSALSDSMRNHLRGCGAPFSEYVVTLRVAGIGIGSCSSKNLKALGLSQARPKPSLHLGIGPSLRFFEAQALESQAQALKARPS